MATATLIPETNPADSETNAGSDGTPAPDAEWGGDGYPKLPEDKQTILKDLLKKALQREIYSRRTEVIDARQQRFYARSVQYIYWNWNTMQFAPLFQGGTGNAADQERYSEVYDIYSAFLRTLVAALTQNPVGAHMVPRTAKRTVDISAANLADCYRYRVEQINKIKDLQTEVARLFCTDGRVVGLVTEEEPDAKYGMDSENEALGAERIEVDGVLEWKVPITQQNMRTWPYAVRSKELEREFAETKYPATVNDDGESKIKAGSQSSGESAYERMARIGVLQGTKLITATSETWEHLATEHIAFFRPSFYRAAAKENRQWLKDTFPTGLKLIVTGDAYCGAWDCSMDKYVRVAHAKPGDGQNRTSLLKAFVAIQDAFNDLWNLRKEMHEYCIPEKWLDKETYDLNAQQERRSEPGNSNPVVLQPNEDIRTKVFVEQSVQISADLVAAINELSGELAQLITAALPALMGSGDEHNETKGGIIMMREQALGQMGIAWGASQQLLGELEELAIKMAAENSDDDQKMAITIPGGRGKPESIREVELSEMKAGDFYAEVDSSFPDTRAMRRAVFNSLIAAAQHSPALQAILQLPENQELFKEMVDDDLEIPGADARIQQLREIEELLHSQPLMPTPEQALQQMAALAQQAMATSGQAPPPPNEQQVQAFRLQQAKPSVGIDTDWDYHQFHLQVIQDWLASEARFEEERAGNQMGIINVKLHGTLHKQAIAQQAAGQQPQVKPPSESINFADLPPDGKIQLAAHAGIKLNPAGLVQQEIQKQATATAPTAGQEAMNG